jgi:hypothetical protein
MFDRIEAAVDFVSTVAICVIFPALMIALCGSLLAPL